MLKFMLSFAQGTVQSVYDASLYWSVE